MSRILFSFCVKFKFGSDFSKLIFENLFSLTLTKADMLSLHSKQAKDSGVDVWLIGGWSLFSGFALRYILMCCKKQNADVVPIAKV